ARGGRRASERQRPGRGRHPPGGGHRTLGRPGQDECRRPARVVLASARPVAAGGPRLAVADGNRVLRRAPRPAAVGRRRSEAPMDAHADVHRLADALTANGRDLEAELAWLGDLLQRRLSAYFAEPSASPPPAALGPPPALDRDGSPYAHFVLHHQLSTA